MKKWMEQCTVHSNADNTSDRDVIGQMDIGAVSIDHNLVTKTTETVAPNISGESVIGDDSRNEQRDLSGSEHEFAQALSRHSCIDLDRTASDCDVDLDGGDSTVGRGSSWESNASSYSDSVYDYLEQADNEPPYVYVSEGSENEDNLSDDSVGGSSTETMNMLYHDASQTKEEGVLSLIDLYVNERWSKNSLEETLAVVRAMLPADNLLPPSLHLLFKYIKSFGNPISEVKHYNCCKCQISKENKNDFCEKCSTNEGELPSRCPDQTHV